MRHLATTSAALAVVAGAAVTALGTQQIQIAPGFNAPIRAIAGPDANGTTFLGGDFTALDAWNTGIGARLSATSGAVDTNLPRVGGAAEAGIYAVAPDGSGGEFIGGYFGCVGGDAGSDGDCTDAGEYARRNLAHIQADGSVDPVWNPDPNATVWALVTAGGSVFAGGSFSQVNGGTNRSCLAKFAATGTGAVDASWNPNADDLVFALAATDTDLYVGGQFTHMNGGTVRNRLAKIPLSGNGTVTAAWNPNAGNTVSAIAISASDIFVGGNFTTINGGGIFRTRLAKIPLASANGIVSSWDPRANGWVRALAVSGTDLFVGGYFGIVNGSTVRNSVAKLSTATGTADASWDPNANGGVLSIAVSGSDVALGGYFTQLNGGTLRNHLARVPVSGSGTVDAWDPNPNGTVDALATIGSDIYAGGEFSRMNGETRRNHVAAIDSAGVLTPWDPNANEIVRALALSGGSVIAGGDFTGVNGGTARNRLAKFPATGAGTADGAWDPNVNGMVKALATSGGDVYAGGAFTLVNGGTSRPMLAKIPVSGSGTVDPTWNPAPGDTVHALVVSGANLYAGGAFNTVNGGTTRHRLARIPLAGTGTVDAAWDPNANDEVHSLAVSGTDLFVGGPFTQMNGATTRNRLAKIPLSSVSGTVDSAWNPDANGDVAALAVLGGSVVAGGDFTQLNGATTRNFLARIPTSGTGLVDAWNPNVLRDDIANPYAFSGVSALGASGTGVLAGGSFIGVGGVARNYLAQIGTDGALGAALPAPAPAPPPVNPPAAGSEPPAAGPPASTPGGSSTSRVIASLGARTRCVRTACTTTGRVPAGAIRVVESATAGGKAATGRCVITRKGKGTKAVRNYRCTLTAPKGKWTITTQAIAGVGTPVAQTLVVKRTR